MNTRHLSFIAGSLLLCLVPAFLPHNATAAPPAKPNILFIITDQQFADAMSCRMGKEFVYTPTMDRLAKTGMLFTRAYSPNPLCMPAGNSIPFSADTPTTKVIPKTKKKRQP